MLDNAESDYFILKILTTNVTMIYLVFIMSLYQSKFSTKNFRQLCCCGAELSPENPLLCTVPSTPSMKVPKFPPCVSASPDLRL